MAFEPKTVVLYSVGLLGASLGLALKTSGFRGTIVGLSSPASIDTARTLGCIDEGYGYSDLPEVAVRADLLFLCSPISVIIETLSRLRGMRLRHGMVITDVGSTKQAIARAAHDLPPHVHFVGGHPMAGSERSGASAADPYLFQNALYVLTPESGAPTQTCRELSGFLHQYLGCTTLCLPADVHDTVAATVSHVPHLLAVALVNLARRTAERIPQTLDLAAGGFRDMTRIASARYPVWHDILATNKQAIADVLGEYIAELQATRERLLDNALRADFDTASQTRNRIPAHNKGFGGQLSDVLLVAPDQPGVIARLAAALAEQRVNIKDIEVLKVREGEGGTIRIAFESANTAKSAVAILHAAGFSARLRE
jgi:prephenate dehydrogenase